MHPKEVSRWWVKGQWEEGGEKSDRFYQLHGPGRSWAIELISLTAVGVIILDISDLAHPRQISRIDIGDFGSIVGAHTYLPIPSRKLSIAATTEAILEEERDPLNLVLVVDISNEERPKPIANFPVPGPPEELGVSDFHDLGGNSDPTTCTCLITNLLLLTWMVLSTSAMRAGACGFTISVRREYQSPSHTLYPLLQRREGDFFPRNWQLRLKT